MVKKLRYTALALVLAFGAYAGIWQIYSKKFERYIESQLAEIQTKGFDVSFDHLKIGGFPFGYDVTVTNLEVKRGEEFRTWVDGLITFSAKFWKPQEISSVAGGTHHLVVDDLKAQGQGFIIKSFTIDTKRFEFFYDNLVVTISGLEVLRAKELEYDMDLAPADKADTKTLRVRLEELEIPALKEAPLGSKIEHIVFDASLKGPLKGDSHLDLVKNWYENDGEIEIKEFALKWGDTTAKGDGDLTLDENLQPIGAFSAEFTGLDKALDVYEKAGHLKKASAAMLKLLKLGVSATQGQKISITIQNRKLLLASIPILDLPEITW